MGRAFSPVGFCGSVPGASPHAGMDCTVGAGVGSGCCPGIGDNSGVEFGVLSGLVGSGIVGSVMIGSGEKVGDEGA